MPETLAIIDSHAHLDMEEFDPDRDEVVGRAFASGLKHILCPMEMTEPKSPELVLGLIERHPPLFAAAGVHPHRARMMTADCLDRIRGLAEAGKIIAVGEIGLDYHYGFSSRSEQAAALRSQLELARETGLPAIMHSRESGRDIVSAVKDAGLTEGGVLHCFTEDAEIARQILDLGFYISFSGILTFPGAGRLREVAEKIPIDRLLVETDAPYLAPVPHRGRRNEPAYVIETARVLAGLKGLTIDGLAEAVTGNFSALFPFEKKPLQC